MNYPAGTLGVLMELYEAEGERFIDYLRSLQPQDWQARAEFAGRMVSIEEVLAHVVGSGLGYADDARKALHGTSTATPAAGEGDRFAQIRGMVRAMGEAVDGAWEKSE